MNIYNIKYDNEAINLTINNEYVNKNIKDLILELDKAVSVIDDLKYRVYKSEYKNKTIDDVDIKLCEYDDKYPYKYEYQKEDFNGGFYLKLKNEDYNFFDIYPSTNDFFFNEYSMLDNLRVYVDVNSLWEEQF